jgi:hypothetical protein
VHLDVSITADGVAVLLPDHPMMVGCTGGDDLPTAAHTVDALEAAWICGAEPDPDFPNSTLAPAPPARLDALIPALRTASANTRLVLQLHPARPDAAWGPAVLDALLDADLPCPIVLSSASAEVLAAARAHAAGAGRDVTTWLDTGPSGSEQDWDERADRANVDGLVVPWDDTWPARSARATTEIVVRSSDAPNVNALLDNWPVTAVLTAWPGRD